MARVIETSKALPDLPHLKHKEGSPLEMIKMNVKYTDIKLCTIVFNVVNLYMPAVFYASVQKHFLVILQS